MPKAIQLYELAFTLNQNRDNTTSDDAFFLMVLMNNLALAKRALNDVVASEKCFQHLLSILMFVVDSGDAQAQDYLSFCDGFVRNISHLMVAPNVTAPAA